MPQLIDKSVLNNLEYDIDYKPASQPATMTTQTTTDGATAMFVFNGGDLHAAAYHLSKSMSTPFANGAIATVLLQESIREKFLEILKPQLKQYEPTVFSQAAYQNALKSIARLKASTITAPGVDASKSPTLVCDFWQEQFGSGTTGVVTLHTFRTPKEAIALSNKETIHLSNASIWNENHSCAYELAMHLKCINFYINCFLVSLEPLKDKLVDGSSFVTIANSYHFETLKLNDLQKAIVFPIGTIFSN